MSRIATLSAILFVSLVFPGRLAAQDAASGVSVDVEVGVVSDYRFRGLSVSGKDPALQGGVTVSLASGLYGYAWASTIDEYGAGADGKGAKVETDFVVGWAGELGAVEVDASVQAYVYPGGSDVNYVEIPVTVARAVGDLRWELGGAYAPSQKALGHEDNVYGWAGLGWEREGAPVALKVTAGYEDGAYAPGGKWDWSLAATRGFGPVTAGVAYVDSDRSDAALVASLLAVF